MYTFEITDYHAIKRAKIRVDGITVLAGVNGCGKSTMSRWLYYLVNATHDFEQYQRFYFIQSLEQEIERVHRVFRTTPKGNNYQAIRNQMLHFKTVDELDWDALKELYYSFIEKAEEDLHDYAETRSLSGRLAYYLLGKDIPEETENKAIIDTYLQECNSAYESGFNKYLQKTESCTREDLEKVITSEYSYGERIPSEVSLLEGETPLLERDTFYPPLMLNRAIYIDSPLAVSGSNYVRNRDSWEELRYFLYHENTQRKELSIEKLNIQIQSIIGGDIQLKDDKFEIEKELHYVSGEQGIDININDAATGIKAFAYLFQLLRNGWLDKETLLMIDEPEAHLHPQWIVEFARLLVKIHKDLGVKILLASHNPDMVAAIQSIAQKEELDNKTVFYLAQKGKDEFKYSFVEKGMEIGDIFTSFNIALSRIEMYGTPMI
jgi:ABC-type transport system involved in cytochrome c biogenesis ATPase subunit